MIDTELVNKAKKKSGLIEQIDAAWREFVNRLRENTFSIPFKGEYICMIKGSDMFVEGYSGLLLIDKLYYNHKTYLLKKPIKYYPFKIYGVYDERGSFTNFVTDPEIGFHYLGLSDKGHTICTGDIQYLNPESFGLLKEAALKIIKAFRVINLESLGTVILPESYSNLKNIFSNKDEDAKHKFEKLLGQNLIEAII
ncbi:MAG: hypothetical protein KKC39_01195 [Candidatus Omnitrophica bacterium]|nr:hypothetical protein [Candidatus Omnitrophota bacterium]MCG2707146.1 hypothetical protein [Candidatus Omnitrophota bacterium]